MERRLGQKMEELANAVTKLAVLAEKTQENERRLGKTEGDLDAAHKGIRELQHLMAERKEEVTRRLDKLENAQSNCPARVFAQEQKDKGKEMRGIRYTLLGYMVVEAVKWYIDKMPDK